MVSYEAYVTSDLFLLSYPINDAISIASDACNIDINDWSASRKRGIWTRTAATWKRRAESVDVTWGTKGQLGGRRAEVTAKIKVASGGSISCRPLELVNASPPCLPVFPSQVLIITVASEAMVTNTQKSRTWVEDTLDFRLRMSERLVRASISSSFNCRASVFAGASLTLIRQFLLPPMSLLSNLNQLSISKGAYENYWPDETVRAISDSEPLQNLLGSGNTQTATLVLLAHQAYDHLGWAGWARLMRKMSDDSSFGIAYMYVFSCIHLHTYSLWFSADHDVKCGRDRSVYGAHGLDYIIALSNSSLQAYAAYLSQPNNHRYDSFFN
jgi:hypothetical protein